MAYNPLAPQYEKLKNKLENKKNEGQRDLLQGLVNTEIAVFLRNGQSLRGILRKVSRYEILVESFEGPLIIPKHAIDFVKPGEAPATPSNARVERLLEEMSK